MLSFPVWQLIGLGIVLLAFGLMLGRILRHAELRGARSDAIGRSKSVILGEVYEKIAPLIGSFPYKPRDMIFVGKGVDYIVFDGLSEGRLREIVFLELKTGSAGQNKNEHSIEEVVRTRKVRYELMRLDARMGRD